MKLSVGPGLSYKVSCEFYNTYWRMPGEPRDVQMGIASTTTLPGMLARLGSPASVRDPRLCVLITVVCASKPRTQPTCTLIFVVCGKSEGEVVTMGVA